MKDIWIADQEKFLKSKPGERIGYLRRRLNMTKVQMAEKCITTEKSIWSWEAGISVPRKRNKKIIAKVLGVDEAVIFSTPKEYKF